MYAVRAIRIRRCASTARGFTRQLACGSNGGSGCGKRDKRQMSAVHHEEVSRTSTEAEQIMHLNAITPTCANVKPTATTRAVSQADL